MEFIFGIKIQDIFFVFLVLMLIGFRKKELFIISALALLLAAMPLFQFQIFFTAQRFVYYAFGLLVVGSIWYMVHLEKNTKSNK